MTTIAMAAGMLPSAMGIGEGGSFRAPMAIAVIGGLIASTILSLVFVPSFYIVMDDLARLVSWTFSRFVGATDEAPVVNPEMEEVRGAVAKTDSYVDELGGRIDDLGGLINSYRRSIVRLDDFQQRVGDNVFFHDLLFPGRPEDFDAVNLRRRTQTKIKRQGALREVA